MEHDNAEPLPAAATDTDLSCILLTTPTSGTGSLWRLMQAISANRLTPNKVAEEYTNAGRQAELAEWRPESHGHIYLWNTPHIINPSFADRNMKMIVHVRDPRDLVCNQYHWVFQHPFSGTDEEAEAYREKVRVAGIDSFALQRDNKILFRAHLSMIERLKEPDENVLILSYNQLCLGFDQLVREIADFLKVDLATVPKDLIECERTDNLHQNSGWIGQMWTGSDVMPGRHRSELKAETIRELDRRYDSILETLRSIEKPQFRWHYSTLEQQQDVAQVLAGKDGQLFLANDSNRVIDQISGRIRLPEETLLSIAAAHAERSRTCAEWPNCVYVHAVIPSKEVAHRAFLPPETTYEGEGPRPFRQYLESSAAGIWLPFYDASLLEPDGETFFFPKSDTHWNHVGAHRYLAGFFEATIPELAEQLSSLPLRRFNAMQQGDLGKKVFLDPEIVAILAPVVKRAQQVFTNDVSNEGCVRWYENADIHNGTTAVVLHDSFTMWLLDIIPELFQRAIFIHTTIFDREFVRSLDPTHVFCLQTERFLPRPPSNRISLLKFVKQQEVEKRSTAPFADWLAKRMAQC